jgi:hypothetical protein
LPTSRKRLREGARDKQNDKEEARRLREGARDEGGNKEKAMLTGTGPTPLQMASGHF